MARKSPASPVAVVVADDDAPPITLIDAPTSPPDPCVKQILLSEIHPSPFQPRGFDIPDCEDGDLVDLAASIRRKGLIQPILVRPASSGYELVVGERRVRASRLESAALDACGPLPLYIPATVRELSDVDAAELTVEENLRRKGLHPLEEAEGVHTLLLLHRRDPEAVAAKLGQTPSWVACRARIHSHLSPTWRALVRDPTKSFASWSAGHLEEIAKLGQATQDELVGSFATVDETVSISELRRLVSNFMRKLGRAPFDTADETLQPTAGACTSCPLTSLASPFLFAEQDGTLPGDFKQSRCLERTCWDKKCSASLERAEAQLRSRHPELLLVAPPNTHFNEIPQPWRNTALHPHAYDRVKKSAEGSEPAMLCAGPGAGRLLWIKPRYSKPGKSRPQSPPLESADEAAPISDTTTLADRRARHLNRRIAWMAAKTKEILQDSDGRTLSPIVLLALAHVFGTYHSRKGVWSYGGDSDPWLELDRLASLVPEDLASDLWITQLQPVLASRLQYCGPKDAPRLWSEIRANLQLLGASYQDLYRAAAVAVPEPKAWKSLPGYQPEDLDAAPLPDAFGPLPAAPDVPFALDDPEAFLDVA